MVKIAILFGDFEEIAWKTVRSDENLLNLFKEINPSSIVQSKHSRRCSIQLEYRRISNNGLTLVCGKQPTTPHLNCTLLALFAGKPSENVPDVVKIHGDAFLVRFFDQDSDSNFDSPDTLLDVVSSDIAFISQNCFQIIG